MSQVRDYLAGTRSANHSNRRLNRSNTRIEMIPPASGAATTKTHWATDSRRRLVLHEGAQCAPLNLIVLLIPIAFRRR